MNQKTSILLFSRDRGFQLEACLRSLFNTMTDAHNVEVTVIFRATNDRFLQQYRFLAEGFPSVEFVEEFNFHNEVIDTISDSDFTLFVVDDTLFLRKWSLASMLKSLNDNDTCLGFSLRLGRNIHYCYPYQCEQNTPVFEELGEGILKYEWCHYDYDFGYPLEVSSSVYRSADILESLRDKAFTRPNELELVLAASAASFTSSKPNLLTLEKSLAFACPVNIVQEYRGARHGQEHAVSVDDLADRFDKGYRMDLGFTDSFVPRSCHQEVQWKYVLFHPCPESDDD